MPDYKNTAAPEVQAQERSDKRVGTVGIDDSWIVLDGMLL